jgi:hypothetical protein
MIQSRSAGITSDPSQPERLRGGAELFFSGDKVAIILEEAIGLARIYRDSQSLMMLALIERGRGQLAYFKNRELQMLVRKLDLTSKGNQVKIRRKILA